MGWSHPNTVADGEPWKAFDYNKYVRDNLAASEAATATQKGRVIIATGKNSLAEGVVHRDSYSGTIFNTSTSSFIKCAPALEVRGIQVYGSVMIVFSGHLTRSYMSFRLVDENGNNALAPVAHRSAVNALSSVSPACFMYTRSGLPEGEYHVEIWGAKNTTTGHSDNGIIDDAELTVVAF